MNYLRIYNQICQRAKEEQEKRINNRKNKLVYYESHHVIPKCMGGLGRSNQWKHENIVLLTAREHFLAHYLLCRIYPENSSIYRAFYMMFSKTTNQKRYTPSKEYEFAKQKFSETHHNKLIENKIKIRERLIGSSLSQHTKEKIRLSNTGKIHSDETKMKMSKKRIEQERWKGNSNPGLLSVNKEKAIIAIKKKLGIPVIQYDICYNEINCYNTIREASKSTGIHKNIISKLCKNKIKSWKGHIFQYKNQNK